MFGLGLGRRLNVLVGRVLAAVLGERSAEVVVGRFWGAAFARGGIRTWSAEERCRRYINERVTGSPDEWPMEWFRRLHATPPFEVGLSLGCGEGALERDVRRKGVCRRVVGVDLSESALRLARKRASDEGLDGIVYEQGDFNALDLPPGRYDIVFFHQSLHHVAELEQCLAQVAGCLKAGGLLYLDEYVGPSRDDWSDDLVAAADEVYQTLPRRLRTARRVTFPVEERDPSEAIRSAEILPLLELSFTVEERRDYGGNLLALLHPIIRWDRLDRHRKDDLLDRLLEGERRLLQGGARSFYTVILARPRR